MQIEVICLARADPKPRAASSSPWVLFPYKAEHLLWPAGSVTAGVGPEGPCEDEDRHWAGGAAPYRRMTEQLKQTSPGQGSYYQEKQQQRSTKGDTQLQPLREPVPSPLHMRAAPCPSQFIQTLRQQETLQVTGAAPQPKPVPRTCFHPHLADEDSCPINTGSSRHQCHRRRRHPQGMQVSWAGRMDQV